MKFIGASVVLASFVSAVPVADTLNEMVIEKAVQFVGQMKVVRKSGGRQLQELDDLDIPEELEPCVDLVLEGFGEEYEPISDELAGDLIECVRDAVIDIAEPCLGRFPGFWSPVKCTLFLLLDPELLLDVTEGNDVILIDENVFERFEVTNETICEETFGSADEPKFPACLSMIEFDDVIEFSEALESNFRGLSGCSAMRDLFEEDGLAETGSGLFTEYEEALDVDFEELFDDELLAGLKANFDNCSEIDGGRLIDELENRFQELGSAPNMHQVSFVSFLAVVISSVFNRN